MPQKALRNEVDCNLTYSLNCLALFAFTNIIGCIDFNFFRADFSFWFFPSSNPDDNLAGEREKEAIKLLAQIFNLVYYIIHLNAKIQRLIDKLTNAINNKSDLR